MSGPLDPLPDRALDMLGTLAAYEQSDPATVALMRSGGDELDLVVSTAETARDQAWPHRADDTYGLLGIHERMLRLNPTAGATIAQRQAAVQAAVQSRKVGAKANWERRMNTLLAGQQWSYQENAPSPGEVTITIPYAQGSTTAAQVEVLARRITPAHIQIVMRYSQGFIVGVSRVGQDAL